MKHNKITYGSNAMNFCGTLLYFVCEWKLNITIKLTCQINCTL